MSIILKALKKAEESKAGSRPSRKSHAYNVDNRKALPVIIAGFVGLVVVFFAGITFFRGNPVSKAPEKIEGKVEEVQKRAEVEKKEAIVPEVPKSLPDSAGLHEDAIRQIKEKNFSGAESILRKAILSKPDDAIMHNHLGLALKNQSRYKEAIAEYEKALQLKPDYYEAMNNLAVAYESSGNRDKAKSLYKRALSIKASYAEAHLNYALLLESEGNNQEAESHYHTFLNLSSDEPLKSKVSERIRALGK